MAAPPQLDLAQISRRKAVFDSTTAQPLPEDFDLSLPGPVARTLALQRSHGNYFVQKAIRAYNEQHPLAQSRIPKVNPPATPVDSRATKLAGKPRDVALESAAPKQAAAPVTEGRGALAHKIPMPGPAKPIPSVNINRRAKTSSTSGAHAPLSGSEAVSSALSAAPRAADAAKQPSGGAGSSGRRAGGPTVEQWKSKVRQAANKELVTPSPKAAPEAVRAIDGEAKKITGTKTDFAAEAQKKIPPPPKVEVPAAPVDTLAKFVHDMIEAVSNSRLTDQKMPELQMSPGHPGIKNPLGQYPTVGDTGVEKQDQPPQQNASPTVAASATDPAAAQADAKKSETEKNLSEAELQKKTMEDFLGPLPPEPAVLKDDGAKKPPPTPISEAAKSEISESVAIVLSKSVDEAKEMVDIAAKTAYPHAALLTEAPEIAANAQVPEKARLDGELHGVAAAAGIEAKDLDEKVARKEAEAQKQCAQTGEGLQSKATEASAETKKKGTSDQKEIAAAAARNNDEIGLKSEAAGTPPDPKLVNEREQRLLDSLDEQSAGSRVAYRKALETREKSIDTAVNDQSEAYSRTGQSEADEIKALYPENLEKAKAEAWPSLSWANRESKMVRDAAAILRRDAEKESKTFQDTITGKQTGAALKVHDWADSRLSRTRSFWEKIIALFTHWEHAAKADTEAWNKARNQDTLDAMAGDLATIAHIKEVAGKRNLDEMQKAIDGLDQEHQILLLNFMKSGGDSIMVVAEALLGRIEERRVPELAKEFREQSLELNEWQKLDHLAQSLNPGFKAWVLAGEVRSSVKGWGTDEDRLFAALKHHTPLEVKAMKLAYAEQFREMDPSSEDYGKGRDMAEDIDDDLSGDEADRAKAALASDDAGQDVFAVHNALTGFWGADKPALMEILRNKTPLERDEILTRYKDEYGIDLRDHLDFALASDDDARDRAGVLLAGDTDKADAIGLKAALHAHFFGGAEINDVDAVYGKIRQEVEADAAAGDMTTAEVEAEYKRRVAAVEQQWNREYSDGQPDGLKIAFKDRLSGGEQDLAIALAEDRHDMEDAARIRMESESALYTSDKKVLSVLRKQAERAETEILRDKTVALNEQARKEKWTPEEWQKRYDEMKTQAQGEIDAKAEQNMKDMTAVYDERYSMGWGPGALTAVIELEMSGNEQEEARLIRTNKGARLTPAEEVYWATTGLGTDEKLLRHGLAGKTKKELEAMRAEYKDKFNADMDEDVFGDVSGRDEHDFGQMLKGKPETPEEEIQRMRENTEYELGSGSGLASTFSGEEADTLRHTSDKAEQAYRAYQEAAGQKGPNSPEAKAALSNFREWSGYNEQSITQLREAADSLTDHVAMAAALIVGTIVAVATAGTAAPAVIAALSALAATSATVSVKLAMKGHAYGIEEYGADLGMGAVDIAAAALTAGVGSALLRTNLLSRLAEDQLVTRVAKYGIAHAGAGLVAGLPTGVVGQLISSGTWASDTPLRTALMGLFQTEGMAAVMAAGFGGIEAVKGGHAPTPHENVAGRTNLPQEVAVHERPSAADVKAKVAQTAKAQTSGELETKLNAAAKPEEHPHTPGSPEAKAAHDAALAKRELKMQGGGTDEGGPPIKKGGGKAPAPDPAKGTIYVEPGSREYNAMLHEGWTDQMLREGLGRFEPPKAAGGPELPPGEFKRGIKTPQEAYAAYNEAMARAPGREVGIFRNLDTGEYVVRVGTEGSVNFPYGDEAHEAVLHYHPNPDNILTYRLPSGADLEQAYLASSRIGRPVTQFVEHPIPGTTERGRTAITVDSDSGRITVEHMNSKGARTTRVFADEYEYSAEYHSRTVMPDKRTLAEIKADIDRWLAQRRGEETDFDYQDEDPAMKATGGGGPPAATPVQFEVGPGAKGERRTKGMGGISRIARARNKFGVFETTIEGVLKPGMVRNKAYNELYQWDRGKMRRDLARHYRAAGMDPELALAKARAIAENYQAAHLWGPGFGDEAAAGMMWAPTDVNQKVQNRLIEKFIRQLRDLSSANHGTVRVRATGVPFAPERLIAQGLPADMPFLEHVQYDISVEISGHPPMRVKVTINAGLPGASARGGLTFDPPEIAQKFMDWFGE